MGASKTMLFIKALSNLLHQSEAKIPPRALQTVWKDIKRDLEHLPLYSLD